MSEIIIACTVIGITIFLYFLSAKLHLKYNSPFSQPIIVVSLIVIFFLLLLNIPYETYMLGGRWIEFLMGPAVVALGIPLYNHFEMLKRLAAPILIGTVSGAFIGVLSGVVLVKLLGFEEEIILAIAPKSVTTAVAVSITQTLGGPGSLAAIFVVIAGVSGVLMSPLIFKLFKLNSPIGRGIGIGSASHAMGTAAAMGRSDLEASLSTIAMVISAVTVSIVAPLIIILLL